VSGLMVYTPFFGSKTFPVQLKAGFTLIIALLLFGTPETALPAGSAFPVTVWGMLFAGLKELSVGILIGLAANMIFEGMQLAGQIIGQQMGFALVNVIDPLGDEQVSLIGLMKIQLALAVFVIIGGPGMLLGAVAQSYEFVPALGMQFSGHVTEAFMDMFAKMLVLAVKLAAPSMVVLFMVSAVLGFLARTVPQMNVFIIGFPLKIGVGLGVLAMAVPFLATYMAMTAIPEMYRDVAEVVRLLGGTAAG